MHPISSIPNDLLRSWLDLVEDRSDRLLASHHLILGPELAGVLKIPEPSADSVIGVLRALRDREPDAFAAARELARHSSPGRRALLEIAVDELLDTDFEWPHPALVLDPPRPELRDLLAACERRLRDAGDDERQHLRDVTRKVANAARIADEANEPSSETEPAVVGLRDDRGRVCGPARAQPSPRSFSARRSPAAPRSCRVS